MDLAEFRKHTEGKSPEAIDNFINENISFKMPAVKKEKTWTGRSSEACPSTNATRKRLRTWLSGTSKVKRVKVDRIGRRQQQVNGVKTLKPRSKVCAPANSEDETAINSSEKDPDRLVEIGLMRKINKGILLLKQLVIYILNLPILVIIRSDLGNVQLPHGLGGRLHLVFPFRESRRLQTPLW